MNGLPKKTELFWFFTIDANQVHQFRVNLKKILPFIATSDDVQKKRNEINVWKQMRRPGLVKVSLANIAFSAHGLGKVREPSMLLRSTHTRNRSVAHSMSIRALETQSSTKECAIKLKLMP